ncbi:MAG TPA: acetate--CoA ligase family protein [Candidatus Methanomethylophilaceae archaeon]|nr:acetate--CoA ligase family protein [Candidatus Methanomethylophilaceae archaeon]
MSDFLSPKSVAIIGASADETKLGGMLLKNMIDAGFDGELYPINPKGGVLQGVKAYTTFEELGKAVDLAVIAVPAKAVSSEVEKVGKAGTKYVSILSAGFKESGPEGEKLENEILVIARKYGVRVFGPNSFGVLNPKAKVNTTFSHHLPRVGNVSMMSQSGAFASSIIDWAIGQKIGISKFVTYGNKCDMSEADMIPYYNNDPETKVIGMYIEGVDNGKELLEAIEGIEELKPLVAFKSGRTEAGSAAASSHTGSLAGADSVYDVIFNKLNIHRVKDADEFFDAISVLSTCSPMKKDGIAIITNAGGLGVMSADAAHDAKYVTAAKLTDETNDLLIKTVPTIAGLTNPIDVRGDAKAEYFKAAIQAVVKDPSVGGIVVMGSPLDFADLEAVAEMLVEMRDDIPVPTTVCFAGGTKAGQALEILKEGNIPTFPTPDRAVRALSILRGFTVRGEIKRTPLKLPKVAGGREAFQKILNVAQKEGRKALTEGEGKQIFKAYGVPIPGEATVKTAAEAVKESSKIGYPVVMKILSPDIAHKTDVGGVVVGVKDDKAAEEAFDRIMTSCKKAKPEARLDGVSIQQMVSGEEVILSMIRDEQFGPVISFGLGGIFVEILGEISQAHATMTEEQMDEMITSTKAYKLLSGARGTEPSDIEAIKDTVRIITLIALENPEIHELEINPVMVDKKGKGCWAVDALCTLM